jgi:hypothetical protein
MVRWAVDLDITCNLDYYNVGTLTDEPLMCSRSMNIYRNELNLNMDLFGTLAIF